MYCEVILLANVPSYSIEEKQRDYLFILSIPRLVKAYLLYYEANYNWFILLLDNYWLIAAIITHMVTPSPPLRSSRNVVNYFTLCYKRQT